MWNDGDKVAVVGAGTMGHGIAQVCAGSGFSVTIYDINTEALSKAQASIAKNLEKGVARNKVTPEEASATRERIVVTTDLAEAVGDAQVVVEAVPERMELKRTIFGQLGELAPSNAILGSNTSSFSISELGEASGASDRVIGLHFFNPVHIMKLLEVVVGRETSEDTVSGAMSLAEKINKTAIRVNDVPGFATSRLGIALAMEAIRMLESGVASAADIDAAMELGYRHPMGPLRLTDLVGLDVRLDIAKYLHKELKSASFEPPKLLIEMVNEGRLGKKSGAGFYEYS